MSDDKVVPIKPDTSEESWTREEIEDIIEQGRKAHEQLSQEITQNITDLANIAHKVGRYQQLLSFLPENSDDAA